MDRTKNYRMLEGQSKGQNTRPQWARNSLRKPQHRRITVEDASFVWPSFAWDADINKPGAAASSYVKGTANLQPRQIVANQCDAGDVDVIQGLTPRTEGSVLASKPPPLSLLTRSPRLWPRPGGYSSATPANNPQDQIYPVAVNRVECGHSVATSNAPVPMSAPTVPATCLTPSARGAPHPDDPGFLPLIPKPSCQRYDTDNLTRRRKRRKSSSVVPDDLDDLSLSQPTADRNLLRPRPWKIVPPDEIFDPAETEQEIRLRTMRGNPPQYGAEDIPDITGLSLDPVKKDSFRNAPPQLSSRYIGAKIVPPPKLVASRAILLAETTKKRTCCESSPDPVDGPLGAKRPKGGL